MSPWAWRTFEHDRVLVLQNLSSQTQSIELADQPLYEIDLLTGARVTPTTLESYQFLWLQPAST